MPKRSAMRRSPRFLRRCMNVGKARKGGERNAEASGSSKKGQAAGIERKCRTRAQGKQVQL